MHDAGLEPQIVQRWSSGGIEWGVDQGCHAPGSDGADLKVPFLEVVGDSTGGDDVEVGRGRVR
jgi:hypothetical protein